MISVLNGVKTREPFPEERLRTAATGDRRAVTEFVRAFWPRIHRIAVLITGANVDGEDVAQDAMLRAVEALPRLDLSRPIEPWMDRVAANAARDWLRRKSRRKEDLLDGLIEDEASVDWVARLDGPGLSSRLYEALASLSDTQRTVVVMRHLLDMPATEVATVLGLPDGTVRSLDHRGLGALRKQLEREEVHGA